ncbi:hypothetical protein CLV99_0507 [Sphingobacterium yanglingense]|uniref:DUF4145 domain-containing protein n=1 Tax=Sphingobacterium yanglingense TaxID=1437280 RepID=A0A4R6WL87_9SPHI|nr:hypothetical protein CLV99_0507 [Sphingobacterium yanglingense]
MSDELIKKPSLNPLYEWAVWGHLSNKKELELILLKGHLMIESTLEACLSKKMESRFNELSFFKKIIIFEEMSFENKTKHNFIIKCLNQLNVIRNELAHDALFEMDESNIMNWSKEIHKELTGKKFTKYTTRTKFIHAFSFLAINILEMDSLKYRMISQINDTIKPTQPPVTLQLNGGAPLLSS